LPSDAGGEMIEGATIAGPLRRSAMLYFRFRCPCCGHICAVRLSMLGQAWPCPYSGQRIKLPPWLSSARSAVVDWAGITEPDLLLEALSCLGCLRPRRLALVAIARTMLPDDDEPGERATAIAERLADGPAPPAELSWARRRVQDWLALPMRAEANQRRAQLANVLRAAFAPADWFALGPHHFHQESQSRLQCDVIRDVYGRWSQPVLVRGGWLRANAEAVPKVARAIYEEKHFADLPVLADALEEAGCAEAALLGHLRAPGPHVRGCWALDAVLGRLNG